MSTVEKALFDAVEHGLQAELEALERGAGGAEAISEEFNAIVRHGSTGHGRIKLGAPAPGHHRLKVEGRKGATAIVVG